MRPLIFLAPMAALGLAACQPNTQAQDLSGQIPPAAVCDATQFDYLKGEPIETAQNLFTPLTVRILAADAFVTRDYDPNRLTITTSPEDTVSRIFCG